MSDMSRARDAARIPAHVPDPPIVGISKQEAWDIARRLGFRVPGDNVMSVLMTSVEIVVTTAKTNEHGHKFPDPDNRSDIATDVYRFRYHDWAAPA